MVKVLTPKSKFAASPHMPENTTLMSEHGLMAG